MAIYGSLHTAVSEARSTYVHMLIWIAVGQGNQYAVPSPSGKFFWGVACNGSTMRNVVDGAVPEEGSCETPTL